MKLNNKLQGIREILQFENKWFLLFTRIFFPAQTKIIYKYKGLNILIDHESGDANGAREVLTSNMYRKYLGYLDSKNSLNVLDLGANNGGFPLLLKSESFNIRKVVCIELNPNTFNRLNFNLRFNFGNIGIAENSAVCGTDRNLTLKLGQGGASDNIFSESDSGESDNYRLTGKTIDTIYAEHFKDELIDICKIDIEGAEFDVFQNDFYECLKNCKYIIMEIHHGKQNKRDFILDKLAGLNFQEIDGDNKNDEYHYVHFFVNKNVSSNT